MPAHPRDVPHVDQLNENRVPRRGEEKTPVVFQFPNRPPDRPPEGFFLRNARRLHASVFGAPARSEAEFLEGRHATRASRRERDIDNPRDRGLPLNRSAQVRDAQTDARVDRRAQDREERLEHARFKQIPQVPFFNYEVNQPGNTWFTTPSETPNIFFPENYVTPTFPAFDIPAPGAYPTGNPYSYVNTDEFKAPASFTFGNPSEAQFVEPEFGVPNASAVTFGRGRMTRRQRLYGR